MSDSKPRYWNIPRWLLHGAAVTLGSLVVVDGSLLAVGFLAPYGPAMIATFGLLLLPLVAPALLSVPAAFVLRRRGSTDTAKGVLIVQGVLVLLNAACTGLVFGTRRLAG